MHQRISIDQICFAGSSLVEFTSHCRALGARNIVISSPSLLAEGALATAKETLAAGDLTIASVNHPFATFPNLEGDIEKARDTLLRLIDISGELGAPAIYVLTGGRGSLNWEQAADRFAEVIAPCTAAARARGMALMIENAPSLYADIHIAHSLADTITLAERAAVGVCIELFFCWAEAGLKALFERAMPRCGLVQVSDYVLGDRSLPGRAVPGDGTVPLESILSDLLEAGYTGFFDIELIGPRINAEGHFAATARAASHLSALLNKLGA